MRRITAIECDVAEMDLGKKFDAAFSNGGTWVIVQSEESMLLGTHLFNQDKDIRGIENVADHLETGGLLALSVHPPHENRDIELPDGVVYSQRIEQTQDTSSDHFFLNKTYSFKKEGDVLAEEIIPLGFYRENVFPEMLADAGFELLGLTDEKEFFLCRKVKSYI